jgi:hypothetical protein
VMGPYSILLRINGVRKAQATRASGEWPVDSQIFGCVDQTSCLAAAAASIEWFNSLPDRKACQ